MQTRLPDGRQAMTEIPLSPFRRDVGGEKERGI